MSQRCNVNNSIPSCRRNHSLTTQDRRYERRVDHRNFLSLSVPVKKIDIRKNMKNGYKLYYTLLSFRGFLQIFTQKESILLIQLILDREVLDLLSKNQLTLNLTLEKLSPKYSQLSIRTKVSINLNQQNSKQNQATSFKRGKTFVIRLGLVQDFTFAFHFRNSIKKLL